VSCRKDRGVTKGAATASAPRRKIGQGLKKEVQARAVAESLVPMMATRALSISGQILNSR